VLQDIYSGINMTFLEPCATNDAGFQAWFSRGTTSAMVTGAVA
jgi:hypothetical protein